MPSSLPAPNSLSSWCSISLLDRVQLMEWALSQQAGAWLQMDHIALAHGQALIPPPPLSKHRYPAVRLALFSLRDLSQSKIRPTASEAMPDQ